MRKKTNMPFYNMINQAIKKDSDISLEQLKAVHENRSNRKSEDLRKLRHFLGK
ncbi:MAG: hypothetical protein GX311_01455 [Bacteroidales bacterium]|jgi:hypothetical protein|nr:hypothetical protein [Bacteroidales bacterium]